MKWGSSFEISTINNRSYDTRVSHYARWNGRRDFVKRLGIRCGECRGIGIISGTGISIEELRPHIRKARASIKGEGYIGVNVLFAMNDFAEKMKAAIEEKVDFIISGAGISRDMYNWGKESGTPVISIVSSARLAKMSERLGASAVVVEGNEAGGHLGTERPLFDILPEVVEAVKIPVIAAGDFDRRRYGACHSLRCFRCSNGNTVCRKS